MEEQTVDPNIGETDAGAGGLLIFDKFGSQEKHELAVSILEVVATAGLAVVLLKAVHGVDTWEGRCRRGCGGGGRGGGGDSKGVCGYWTTDD